MNILLAIPGTRKWMDFHQKSVWQYALVMNATYIVTVN